MEEKKLICPVRRIENSSMDLKIDLQENKMNIKVDISTKNIVKLVTDFINKNFNKEKKNG